MAAIDFAYPAPQPAPFTTIAWRLAHVIVGVFAMRNHSHFGGPPADYRVLDLRDGRDDGAAQLDDAYRTGSTGVRALSRRRPVRGRAGRQEGPYADYPMADLVLHINREAIHHGAEIACIRDLYVHTTNERENSHASNAPARRRRAPVVARVHAVQQNAFFAVAYGLTDEQARSTPSVSALSIGGLIKHAAGCSERLGAAGRRGARYAAERRAPDGRDHGGVLPTST